MNIQQLLTNVLNLINGYIIPLMVALAILAFFWGIIKYIWGAGGGEAKAEAVKIMTAGIIGLVVMLSVWGIVVLVSNSIGISGTGNQTITTPKVIP